MSQQVLVTNTLGGYSTVPKLSKQVLEATNPMYRFRQFVSFKEAFGQKKGQTVLFDRYSNMNTGGGTLSETSTIPRNNIVFGQSTLTLVEYGNAIGKTLKLEELADFDINNPVHRALRNDMAKTLDWAVANQFRDTVGKYVCVSSTSGTLTTATTGTAGATSTSNLNAYHVKQITDQLMKWNVEPFDDGDYVCIASVAAIRGLKDDTSTGGWIDAARYAGSKRLWTGEVGEYMGVRFIVDNGSMRSNIGNADSYGEAVVFGQETVTEAVAHPEEIRVDTPRDFGRDMGVAWYFIGGFKCAWCSIALTEAVNETYGWVPHIIHVTSQNDETPT